MVMRDGFERLVEQYLKNISEAKETINALLFQAKLPRLSAEEIHFMKAQLSSVYEISNPAHLTLKASMHQTGHGYRLNYHKAGDLYVSAIFLNDPLAMTNRAHMYRLGHGEVDHKPNYRQAIALYEQAIKQDELSAFTYRAYMHQYGLGDVPNYASAIELYDVAIYRGDSVAMCHRAEMHRHGQGNVDHRPNPAAAIELYQRAAALDNPTAMRSLAQMYRWGEGGPANYPAAISLYERAMSLGDHRAISERAMMYELGLGTDRDKLAAIRLYKKAMALGDHSALYRRQKMEDAFFLEQDFSTDTIEDVPIRRIRQGFPRLVRDCLNHKEKARNTLYRLVSQALSPALTDDETNYLTTQLSLISIEENTSALVLKGLMHHIGVGYPQSFTDAIALYDQAIELNDSFAMAYRGYLYQNGLGESSLKPKETEAIDLYHRAIALNNSSALCMLAEYFRSMETMLAFDRPPDYRETIDLYDKAVALGDTWAMRMRAEMYHDGIGEIHNKPDYLSAMILYERASKQHDIDALFEWANLCMDKLENFPFAMKLYKKASALGCLRAQEKRHEFEFDIMTIMSDPIEDSLASVGQRFFSSWSKAIASTLPEEEEEELADTPKPTV